MSTPRLAQDDAASSGAAGNRNMSESMDRASGGAFAASANEMNFGSARSDFGERAYGGTLDATGQGGAAVDDFAEGRVDRGSRGYSTLGRDDKGQQQRRR